MSDERTAAVNDPQRLPSRAELAALLDRYFAGPIDDSIVNRLESQCHELWADPSRRDETVTSIGARWGLTNPAHLSRLFRDEFGVSPTEYRAEHLYENEGT